MGDLAALEKILKRWIIFVQHLATCILNVNLSSILDWLIGEYGKTQ